MAYKVIILYRLYMPSYFLGTFTEYPWGNDNLYLYDEARRFDWGVSSNIGIETHHWYAKLQYDLSLGKEGKNDVIGANYHTLTLSVGYKFGL